MTDATQATIPSGPLMTADGIPLKRSLQRSLRVEKLRAFGLVAGPALFLVVMFIWPLITLFAKSVDDSLVNNVLPRTMAIYEQWDGEKLPSEEHFAAMYEDLTTAERLQVGKVSTRMNYAKSGWKSLIKKSNRKFKKFDTAGPFAPQMIEADKRWGDVAFWRSLGIMKDRRTTGYYWNAIDRTFDNEKNVIMQPENRRVYVTFWKRTLFVSALVTLSCLILAYPVAYLLATLPLRYSNLLMIAVLMPFWTSLLVRIVAWMIMLQQQGVLNDTLVALGILCDDCRLPLMYNFNGTIIVMTQVLLPFMILPLYSVMRGIPPTYMKAAQNLGATPTRAFIRIYMPQTIPGIGAGVILVFIVAIGYYITPELVGGKDGQMIGNQIAYHLRSSLNWGLASAMGVMLLAAILVLYYVYDKIVGIDNMRLG